ncbi:MAG: gliding motility-associated ABC transporter ATP-binding subunit GldA [Flavobacteriales bacterium]|nr:gliding motility-associated ABC transporter ATP-binding subunit GldA [Flavobacteriales bacterium]
MSIIVKNLSKIYGTQKALQEVSFEVNKGEILGFLGPNGAGKSTLMKILTGYIPQTNGDAKICNLDINENSLETRSKIGYLPEHNPLYLDMYVKEYLEFVANIYEVNHKYINEMIEKTGLQKEQHKLIGSLSKGYRQRVGLAQALLHNPEVLILDEPTTGLDPNQLVEIRSLIKEIGREKTVMLSTHIMQEVEAICDRVIIINKGQIVANKTIRELQKSKGNRKIITVEFDKKAEKNKLMKIGNVLKALELKGNQYQVFSDSKFDLRPALFEFAVNNKLTVLQMNMEEQKLESIFQELTK